MNPRALLARFLELADGSEAYFVSGSFSFLPLIEHYREPDHDLDVAVDARLLNRILGRLGPEDVVRELSCSEVAVADQSAIARFVPGRTSFVHITTRAGLLDLASYTVRRRQLSFSLGFGLRLFLPPSVVQRVKILVWQDLAYRAGPPEIAFLPKAIARHRSPARIPDRHREDLRRLEAIVDPRFVAELVHSRGLRCLGLPLPRALDPFAPLAENERKSSAKLLGSDRSAVVDKAPSEVDGPGSAQ